MLLLRTPADAATGAEVWTARVELHAEPDEVLRALTDPEMIAGWAPVAFDVEGLADGRLPLSAFPEYAVLLLVVATVPVRILLTWVWNSTHKSLPLAATSRWPPRTARQ